MADFVTRLKVESKEYDSKIKRAAQGLLHMEQACRKVGGTLAILENDELEFVKGLGKMETVSMDARGQLNELTKAFTDLSIQYKRLTDEEKQGDFGKALSASLDQLKTRIQDTKKELSGIDSSLNGGKGAFNQLFSGVAGKFGMSPQMFTGVGAAIAGVGMAAKLAGDNIRTAFNFERSISGLSALTGMVGKDLEKLKNNAIELGSTTTLTASQVADAFRLIGSQQPQLLSDADALKEVTKYAIRLSEAAGIDLATASQTLSTSINQMGGDSANAARYVNVLAAASQKGAGDISWLGEAITKAATAAKAVGTDYEELVANLEQLAKAGFDASTAGTALRSIIMNLEKQANSQFKPSVVGLTQAFENLGKAQLNITGYQNIAGKMFATQAKVLAEAAKAAKEMEEAITGTNIAEEQAATNTDNLSGSLKSLASAWEGLNLHINSSNGFLKTCVDWLKDVVKWADAAFTSAGRGKKALEDLQSGGRVQSEINQVQNATNGEGDSAQIKQQQILDNYDKDIQEKEAKLEKAKKDLERALTHYNPITGQGAIQTARLIKERLENEINALQKMKESFSTESNKIINPQSTTPTPQLPTTPQDGDTNNISSKKSSKAEKEITIQQQIAELEKEAVTATAERQEEIRATIQLLDQELARQKAITDALHNRGNNKPIGDSSQFEAQQKVSLQAYIDQTQYDLLGTQMATQIEANIQKAAQNVDVETLRTLLSAKIKYGLDNIDIPADTLMRNIMGDGMDIDDSYWQDIENKINEQLQSMNLEPIKLNFDTGKLATDGKTASDTGKETAQAWRHAASAIGSVNGALQSLEDPSAKIAGIVGQAIANIALGFSSATVKTGGVAGVFGWIAAATAGLATMTATIAQIKSVTAGSYAEGGIVPGNNYNDGLIVNVSSGELILNRAQQATIAGLLESRNQSGQMRETYVRGETIYLALTSYMSRTGKSFKSWP